MITQIILFMGKGRYILFWKKAITFCNYRQIYLIVDKGHFWLQK